MTKGHGMTTTTYRTSYQRMQDELRAGLRVSPARLHQARVLAEREERVSNAGYAGTRPGSYGIKAINPRQPGAIVCGECGRAWADDITPAGRCPWEDRH